ncbi:uncharacterized protein LOC144581396 [Callithrix jacchus]
MGPQGGAREAAAKGLRLPRPAQAATSGPALQAGRRCILRPSPGTRAALVQATTAFIFLNYISRKAKAKTSGRRDRGRARRVRAGSQRRGRRARVCAWPVRWQWGWSRARRVPASEPATHTCLGGTLARAGQARCKWKGAPRRVG